MLGYIDDGSLDAFKWYQSTGRIRLFHCPPQAASCLIISHHGLTVSAHNKSMVGSNQISKFEQFD
jgi:hypothetical protein